MKIPSVIALGLSAAAVGLAMAQSGPPSFTQLDADGDGYISVNEAEKRASLLELFNKLDTDGDGKLSHDEYAAYKQGEEQ